MFQGSGSGDHSNAVTNQDSPILKFFQKPEERTNRVKQAKPFLDFLSYYKRKVYPDKLDQGLVEAIEHHIEEIEPQFRSASFAQLWHALRLPLTEFFRPKSSDNLLAELVSCLYGNTTKMIPQSKLPEFIEEVRRDLIICKIGEILDANKTQKTKLSGRPVFHQLWKVLRGPMTPLLVADLRTMVRELAQYTSRFEMAGIQYQLPGKMSEIRRDVVICKVDDVFNVLYDTNVIELEREL